MAKPTCMDCGKQPRLKAACICEACMRAKMDEEQIRRLLNPKGT